MRKILYILVSCLLLLGCSKDNYKKPESPTVDETSTNTVNVGSALEAIGYQQIDNTYVRKVEDHGNDFLYAFFVDSGDFQMIQLPSLRTYRENVRIDNDTYVNSIMNEQLVQAKLNPSLFGSEVSTTAFDVSSFVNEYTMVNLHQLLLKSGYVEKNGFYEKHFDNYSLAFNVKGKAITLYTKGEYYRYLSDYTMMKYDLLEGYCTYNLYDNLMANCSTSDVNKSESLYESLVYPELVRLDLKLQDLDTYFDTMIEVKWGEVRSFESSRFPTFDTEVYTPDPDSEEYFNLMLSRRGAKFDNYSITMDYGNTKAKFYYEDKTFTLASSKAIYNFGNDIGYYDGCYYDFNTSKGTCGDSKVDELIRVKNALYGVLDRAYLNSNELHLCFNMTNKYDKNIATEVGK